MCRCCFNFVLSPNNATMEQAPAWPKSNVPIPVCVCGESQQAVMRKQVPLCDIAVTHGGLHVVSCAGRLDDVQAA